MHEQDLMLAEKKTIHFWFHLHNKFTNRSHYYSYVTTVYDINELHIYLYVGQLISGIYTGYLIHDIKGNHNQLQRNASPRFFVDKQTKT